ncbi:hypothetical protein M885DRAFT_533613, partial [Pelagophyceae sp. CCMP2097]
EEQDPQWILYRTTGFESLVFVATSRQCQGELSRRLLAAPRSAQCANVAARELPTLHLTSQRRRVLVSLFGNTLLKRV